MSRGREPLGPTQWVIDSDETCLMIYVNVTQTMGTIGRAVLQEHHLRDDALETRLAGWRGDSKDNSFEALLRAARALLDAAEKARALERERQSRSN